jgi:WG containing repeat
VELEDRSTWTDRLFPVFVREGRSRKRYKAGYINCLGEIVVGANFEEAYPFRNGLASIKRDGLWGAINSSGDLVIPPAFGGPLIFSEGFAAFSSGDTRDGDKRGVLSATGEIIVKPRYRHVSHFSGGLACIYDGQLYGYIDGDGNQVIPPFFEDARAFSEGVAAVKLDGAWGYIHPDASTAIAIRFICERGMAGPFREGLARVARNGKWGHINKEAKFVVEPRFDMSYEFSEGMATVVLNKRTGYVDCKGDLAVPTSFLRGDRFSSGVAAVNVGSGEAHRSIADACEIGFINAKGQFVITPKFFATGNFQDGLCLVETEKDILYVDRKGAPVWRSGWVEFHGFDPYHLLPTQP